MECNLYKFESSCCFCIQFCVSESTRTANYTKIICIVFWQARQTPKAEQVINSHLSNDSHNWIDVMRRIRSECWCCVIICMEELSPNTNSSSTSKTLPEYLIAAIKVSHCSNWFQCKFPLSPNSSRLSSIIIHFLTHIKTTNERLLWHLSGWLQINPSCRLLGFVMNKYKVRLEKFFREKSLNELVCQFLKLFLCLCCPNKKNNKICLHLVLR